MRKGKQNEKPRVEAENYQEEEAVGSLELGRLGERIGKSLWAGLEELQIVDPGFLLAFVGCLLMLVNIVHFLLLARIWA